MKIVRVTAFWCMSCLSMKKIWKKTIEEVDNVEIIDYDFDMDSDRIENLKVGEILPVVIFFKDNKEVKRVIGEKSFKQMMAYIEEINE